MAQKLDPSEVRWTEFPDQIRPLFGDLWQEVAALHIKWATFLQLYDTPEKIKLLNATAPSCFRVLHESLRNDITMSFGRLLDRAETGRRKNLSLVLLVNSLNSHCDAAFVADLQADLNALRTDCQSILQWRNRRVGHKDLTVTLTFDESPLPNVTRPFVIECLRRIETLMNSIERQFKSSRTGFSHPLLRGSADDLIFWLNLAHDADEKEKKLALGGTI